MMTQRRLLSTERQELLRQRLEEDGGISVSALAAEMGLSEMTIRRDLEALMRRGIVRRTHGGAVPARRLVFEQDFREQLTSRRSQKQAIAREALKLVRPGMRLIIDTGTTTLELAALIADWNDLAVITTSLAVISQLQFSDGIQTTLLGGVLRRGSPDLTGGVTEHCLDLFAADIVFQGADGIGPDGSMYTSDLRLARVDAKMRTRAPRTYILADSSKIGRTALARNGSLSGVEALITDNQIDKHVLREFRSQGINVIIARDGSAPRRRKDNQRD
ncbi:MAG: DeoR/GlpR family DNA-binding transcription regulator [bacterium]|nr:DeoR/GlpR family DNA-binding transcription regulator [Candidatus Sumerlaeota bacterium]